MNNKNSGFKKVLFILQLPPPVHGASMMNKHVVNSQLLKSRFDTEVINLQFAKNMKDIENFRMRKVWRVLYFAGKIIGKVSAHKPDLVYFTLSPKGFAFYRDVFYVLLLKLFRQKIAYHLHGKGIEETANRHFINKLLCQWIFSKVHVICLSQKLTEDIRKISKATPFIVPNGITALPQLEETSRRLTGTIPLILYLSNYIKEKGVLVLVDALKILHDRGFNFQARLVGAPGDLSVASLQNQLARLGLEGKVEVVGPRYGEDKIAEFRQADIFVLPTFYRNEAFPLVNLEAMQCGLPVISTNEGGIPDMLRDNVSGFIVETRNPQMLADKIAVLLEDEKLRKQMGKRGLVHFSEHYTLEKFEANITGVLQAMLATS